MLGRSVRAVSTMRADSPHPMAQASCSAQLVWHARDGVIASDAAGHIVECNPAAERLLGWPRSLVLGRPLAEVLVPAQAGRDGLVAPDWLAGVLRTADGSTTLELRRRDGGAVRVELSACALAQGRGVFLRELTASTQQALRQSEAHYRAVVDRLSEGMIVVQDEKVVYANPRASEIVDMPLAQMQQIGFLTRVHPDDQALVLDRQRRRLAGESPPDRYELRLLLPGDVVRWIAIGVAVVPWNGRPAAMTLFTDITERKAMLEAIRASEQQMRALVDHTGEGAMVVIEVDKPVFVNQRALEIMGTTREALDREGYLHRLHPDDRALVLERRRRRLAGDPVESRYEVRLVDRGGHWRWIDMGTAVVPWSGQRATLTFFSDITDRKLMLQALHHSEQRYRNVVERVGEGMLVLQRGVLVFVNERAVQIAQRSRASMLGQRFDALLHPDDQGLFAQAVPDARGTRPATARRELRLLHAGGAITWIEIGITQVPWDGHDALLAFVVDVSQRKALQARLSDTLAERESILDTARVGIAFLTMNRRLQWANRAMARIFRTERALHQPSRWTERSIAALFPTPQDHARVRAAVQEHLAAQLPYEAELQLRRSDGVLFWASVTGTVVSGREADHGTVWTVMDVTERKQLEVALQRSASEREAIFASALVGLVFSVQGQIRWVNDKLLDMLGYSREEWQDPSVRPVLTQLTPDAQDTFEGTWIEEQLQRDGHCQCERQIVRKSGERLWVQLAGRRVLQHQPDAGTIWTFLDITDRKQAEDQVRAALAHAQELNVLRARFVAMTSHEFRAPLATIQSCAELVAHYGERMPQAERVQVLGGIVDGVHRMTDMLDHMLQLGRTDAPSLQCSPQPLDLAALCEQCAEEVRTQHPARAGDIVVEYLSTRAVGAFDERLLRHVLANLLANAVKYSPDGGPVCLRVRDDGARFVLEVSDQGIGVPAHEQERLFDAFQRASNVGAIPGTGLGLSIVKQALLAHGGRIELHSEQGRGSCFRVWL
jgi:PAS domain S-box-containing protein